MKSSRIFGKFTTKINEQIKYVLSYTLFKSKTMNQLVSVDFNPEAYIVLRFSFKLFESIEDYELTGFRSE